VHAGEIGQLQIVLAPIDLEPATCIRAAVGEDLVADPVGEAGSGFARALGFAAFADAADESGLASVAPKPRHKAHDVLGIVLPVAVHGGDHRCGCGDHA